MSLLPDDRPMVDSDRLPMLLKPPKFQGHKYPRPMHLQAPMSALNGFINSMGIESPALLPCVPVEPSPTTGIHTLIPPLFQGVSNRAQYGPLLGAQPKPIDHRTLLDSSPVSKPGKQSAANDDGYQWRKYGEKIVKGSPFPRSYYKCSHPGCQAKKIVERRDDNIKGKIDYKGSHNHVKPSTPRGIRPKPKTKEEEEAAGCMPTYNIGVPSPVSARRTLIPIPDNLRTRPQRPLDAIGRGIDEFDDWDGEEDDEDDDDDEDEMEFPEPELKTAQNDARAASKALEALRKVNASASNRQGVLALEDMGMPMLGHSDGPSTSHAEPADMYRPPSQAMFPPSGPAKRDNNDPLQVLADEAEREAFRGVAVRHFGLTITSASTPNGGAEPPNKKPRLTFSGPAPAMLASALQELAGGRLPLDEGKGPTTQTIADNEHYDDGFKWRKYGQKTVKSNPHPRSYYKCTFAGCNMRKHVERSPVDANKLVITYEGQHNHAPPNGSNRSAPRRLSNGEMDARASTSPSPKPRFLLSSGRNPFASFVNSRSPQQGSPAIGRLNPMGPQQLPRNPFSPPQRHLSGGQPTPKLGMNLHDNPSPSQRDHHNNHPQQLGGGGYMPSPHPLAQYGQHGPSPRTLTLSDAVDHARSSMLGPRSSDDRPAHDRPALKRAKVPPALQLNIEDSLDAALALQSLPYLSSGLSPAPGGLHHAHAGRQFDGMSEAAHPLHQFADSMIQTPREDSPSLKMLPGGALNGATLSLLHPARDAAHEDSQTPEDLPQPSPSGADASMQ